MYSIILPVPVKLKNSIRPAAKIRDNALMTTGENMPNHSRTSDKSAPPSSLEKGRRL